jgi:hypothetical protein
MISPVSRWWFLFASIVLYGAAMALPAARDEGCSPPGFLYLVGGGYFLLGALMAPANPLFLVACVGLVARRRRLALILGICALSLGILGVIPLALASNILAFPAYWVWLSSFIVLIVGACSLPRTQSSLAGLTKSG